MENKTAANYSFKKYQPGSLRVWHWLNALAILGLLGTVLLRKTFLSWRSNAKLIEERVTTAGGTVSTEVAQNIAKEIRNIMWDWHIYLGYALGALLLFRLLCYFVSKKAPAQVIRSGKFPPAYFYAVKVSYALFYLVSIFMVISGLLLIFKQELALSKDFAGSIKDTHELLMWFFVAFTGLHILGVFAAENRGDKGLVSDMINGGDQ